MSGEHHEGFRLFDDDEVDRMRRDQIRRGLHEGPWVKDMKELLRKAREQLRAQKGQAADDDQLFSDALDDFFGSLGKQGSERWSSVSRRAYRSMQSLFENLEGLAPDLGQLLCDNLEASLSTDRPEPAEVVEFGSGAHLRALYLRARSLRDRESETRSLVELLRAEIARDLSAASPSDDPDGALFALAEETGLDVADLSEEISADVIAMVPKAFAETYKVVPLELDPDTGQLVIALADPRNPTVLEDLSFMLNRDVRGAVADPSQVDAAIERYYGKSEAQPQPLLNAGYLLMAALDGELSAQEASNLEDQLSGADAVVRMEWEWLQRLHKATSTLALAPVDEDRLAGFVAGVQGRIDAEVPKPLDAIPSLHMSAGPAQRRAARAPRARTRRAQVIPPEQGGTAEGFGVTLLGDELDFFDLYAGADGLHLALGEASASDGQAVIAACRAYLRAFALAGDEPAEVLARTHSMLHGELRLEDFVSALVLWWDEASERLRWSSASTAQQLFHYRAESGETEVTPARGIPLGVISSLEGKTQTHELALAPGDRLLLVTDGVTKLGASPEDVCRWLARNGTLDGKDLCLAFVDHCKKLGGGQPLEDDATVVVLARRPQGGRGDSSGLAAAVPVRKPKKEKAKRKKRARVGFRRR